MTLSLDTRQRALLQHMGIRLDFLPPLAAIAADPPAAQAHEAHTTQAAQAAVQQARIAAARPQPPRPVRVAVEQTSTAQRVIQTRVTEQGPSAEVSLADWGALQQTVNQCTACELCKTRKQTVFGAGTQPDATATGVDVMIVGEAPGENEDKQGLPFVGAAGLLLDQMLTALGLSRQPEGGPQGTVFITNVLKCRPPENRNPSPQEMAQCLPYLRRQIELARPKVLLALGRFGAQALLSEHLPHIEGMPLGKLRLNTHQYQGTPLVVTFHPAYVLRNPVAKAQVWADLCLAHSMLPRPERA